RLLDDLHAGIAVERIGLRLEFLGAEFRDHGLGFRLVARIGAVGHQRAFDARAADGSELVGGDAVAAHQRRLDALVAHLPHDEAAFGIEPAEINQIGARLFDLGDQRRVILLAGIDAFVEHLFHAAGLYRLQSLVGEALAVGGLVVDEGDLLAFEVGEDIAAGDLALLIVAAAGAENVPHAALGDGRIGRGRRDLEDAVFLVDFGGRDGDAGIVVADDEFDAVA